MPNPSIEISCSDVSRMLGDGDRMLLIDCREPEEHSIVNLPGATLIPLAEIPSRISQIKESAEVPVVVHCHHGMRSLQAANWLRGNGVPHAQSMAGGIDAWADQVDPEIARY